MAAEFGSWGRAVVGAIFNERSLARLIGAAMIPQPIKEMGPLNIILVVGTGTPRLAGPIQRTSGDDPCIARFEVAVNIALDLHFLNSVPYEGVAHAILDLTVTAEAPATLILGMKAREVTFQTAGNDLVLMAVVTAAAAPLGPLAAGIGFASTAGLLNFLKQVIADQVLGKVEKALKESAPAARVDLFSTILGSQAAADPQPGNEFAGAAPLVAPGKELVLSQGKDWSYFDVLAAAGEEVGFMIALLQPPASKARLSDALKGTAVELAGYPPGGKAPSWTGSMTLGMSPGVQEADFLSFIAKVPGRFRIGMRVPGAKQPLGVSVRQIRRAAPPARGDRICFPDVGHAALLGALGAEVVRDGVAAALAGMTPETMTTTYGPLTVIGAARSPAVAPMGSDGRAIRFNVSFTLDLTGKLEVAGLKEAWKILPRASFVLAVAPDLDPLGLHMSPEGKPKVTLRPEDVTHPGKQDNAIRDAIRGAVVEYLPGIVEGILAERLNSPEQRKALAVNLEKMIEDAIAERGKAIATPEQPPDITTLPVTLRGSVGAGRAWFDSLRCRTKDGPGVRLKIRHRYPPGTKGKPPEWSKIPGYDRQFPVLYFCNDANVPFSFGRYVLTRYEEGAAWDESECEMDLPYDGRYGVSVRAANVPVEFEITVSRKGKR